MKDTYDLIKGMLTVPSVLSLLTATAIGVWACDNKLNDINNGLAGAHNDILQINGKLDAHSGQITSIQGQMSDLSLQVHDIKLTSTIIEKQTK